MVAITTQPTYSVDGNGVIRGTTDADDGTRALVKITPTGQSTPEDVYHGAVAGGVYHIPTNDSALSIPHTILTASSQALDDNNYVYDPNPIKLAAPGAWLVLYWKGGGHIDNDGAIYGKITLDDFDSFGGELVIADHGSGYDTRNIGGGVNPVTGEITLFYRVYNVGVGNVGTYRVRGSADASTWGAPVDVTSWAGAVSPFGRIVWGVDCAFMVFHLGIVDAAWILRSTDNFETVTVTTVNDADEAWIVPIDDDRFVFVSRNNESSEVDGNNYNTQRFCTTSDRGVTWSALSAPYPFADNNFTANIGDGVLVNDAYVLQLWVVRGPEYNVYASWLDKEAFFLNPQHGWSQDLSVNPNRKLVYDGPDPGAGYGLNFGSPKLAIVEGHEYAPVMFVYEPASYSASFPSDEGEYVEIAYMTLPRP